MNCWASCDSWGFCWSGAMLDNTSPSRGKKQSTAVVQNILPKPSEDKNATSLSTFIVQKSSYYDQSVSTAEPMKIQLARAKLNTCCLYFSSSSPGDFREASSCCFVLSSQLNGSWLVRGYGLKPFSSELNKMEEQDSWNLHQKDLSRILSSGEEGSFMFFLDFFITFKWWRQTQSYLEKLVFWFSNYVVVTQI